VAGTRALRRLWRDRAGQAGRRLTWAAVLAAMCAFGLLAAPPAFADSTTNCHIGAYRLASGLVVDIAPSDGDTLRWRLFTGETGQLHSQPDGTWKSTLGWSDRPDGKAVSFSDCATGEVTFGGDLGHRIAFDVTNTSFVSHGVKLAGRLVMPQNLHGGVGKVPVVVLIHGSEHDSALDFYSMQRMFPAQGIGVFVYDKRGTGASGGVYTQDFETLADDAVAALQQARTLGGARVGRIGYQGGSEGGWVAPLAAEKAPQPVDFTIVSFGLAVTILEEDQQSVALDMHNHHHDADAPKALELARAGEHLVETGGQDGYAEFDALRQQDKAEPWYKDVHGDFVFMVLPLNQAQITEGAKQYGLNTTPFRYEPMPVLRRSTTPQLWVLGSDDLDAPSAETSQRIRSLIAAGKPYTLALYPGAEHGMTEYELSATGERISTRYAPGYFQMMADFIRTGRIGRRYGDAAITRRG
jgi:uncharacterized protein